MCVEQPINKLPYFKQSELEMKLRSVDLIALAFIDFKLLVDELKVLINSTYELYHIRRAFILTRQICAQTCCRRPLRQSRLRELRVRQKNAVIRPPLL